MLQKKYLNFVINAVRSSKDCKNVKIMVGGRAFDIDKQLWKTVNADGYARTSEEVVKIAGHLVTS